MDIIIPKAEKFVINDVEVSIDPLKISIFKEGLNYSWKTLRTKSSSKIVNGNSVFHLKLSMIFTKSMFLEMHRLICQMRNSPLVQIKNELISESAGVRAKTPTFFSVSSLQIMPRADSPFTVDMELDLKYFNQKSYAGKNLFYKKFFESIEKTDPSNKVYVSSFSVYDEELTKLYLEQESGSTRSTRTPISEFDPSSKIRKYRRTTEVKYANESYAYIRYSNYLQIKSLKENFLIEQNELKIIFGDSIEQRKCISLCNHPNKMELINNGNIYDKYYHINFSYQKYMVQQYTVKQSEALRKYFYDQTKAIKNYDARAKKIAELKRNLLENNNLSDDLKSIVNAAKKISDDRRVNIYAERKGINNVFFINEGIEVDLAVDNGKAFQTSAKAVITSLACGFTNLISSLPISGQEYPVHQYMGASEPIYNMSVLGGVTNLQEIRHLNPIIKEFEKMRSVLQRNAVNFKMIPDAAYFEVNSFFTKLLGTSKRELDVETSKPTNRNILKSFNVNTVEGAPGSQALQLSFSETNNFSEEEIKPVFTLGGSDRIKERVRGLLDGNKGVEQTKKENKSSDISYKPFVWKTAYFNADEYYRKVESKGFSRQDFDKEYDKAAHDFCRQFLDRIQRRVKGKIIIMSSIDQPSTGIRKTRSRHYSGEAVDITVEGMTKLDLMRDIAATGFNLIGVIAYYDSPEQLAAEVDGSAPIFMTAGGSKGFVHVDSRVIVKRFNSNGEEVTTRGAATESDTFKVESSLLGVSEFYGIDVNNNAGYVKTIGGQSLKGYLLSGSDQGAIDSDFEENIDENEIDEAQDAIAVLENIRPILSKKFSPFSTSETENLEVSIKKYKELSDTEKAIVQSRFSLNEINPELEIRVVEGAELENYETKLSEQGYEYELSEDKDKLYLPRNANNSSLAKESLETKALIAMYDAFDELASLMLTEPKLYSNSPEAETKRIKDELSSTELNPSMIGNFLGSLKYASGNQSFTEDVVSGLGEGAGLGTATSFIAAKVGVGVGTAIGTGVGILGSAGLLTTYYNSYAAGGENYNRGYTFLEADIKAANISVIKKEGLTRDVAKFYSNLGESDDVPLAFTSLLNYVIAETETIKKFERESLNLKNRLNIINALGNYKKIGADTSKEGFTLEGALSEEVFVGELRRIFTYYFGFPYVDTALAKQEDFQDLFNLEEKNGSYQTSLRYEKDDYIPSSGNKYRIISNDKKFPFTNDQLKRQQNIKIGYLNNLKNQIIEEIASIPEIKKRIGIEESFDIFDVSGENAYPDIVLPVDPANDQKNIDLHPTFFFYDKDEDSIYSPEYINPIMRNNLNKVLEKSKVASDALRKGLFTGSLEEVKREGELLKLEVGSIETFDKILRSEDIPALEAEEGLDKNSAETDTTPSTTTINPDVEPQIKEQIKTFKELRKSFDDVFGGSSRSKKNASTKSPEEDANIKLFEDAVSSCKNLMRSKKLIEKAFPTYRLYLIEEDSTESDKLSVYDDFYSYNGVKSFTVTSHKNMAASTAVIQIQNISGVLDGTKPEVVRDVDIRQDLKPDEELEQQSSVSSIIMRPGINIQLRAGYNSNPNKLDIIFTGRVTEVKNSSSGEMLEVVAQSFGVELIAKKLGSVPGDPFREKVFYNTHSLLGSLMLSEELKHFGRVKTGRRFQTGEAKQLSIDLNTGKDENWTNFDATNWITDTLNDYGLYIALGSIVLGGVGNVGKVATKLNPNNVALNWIGKTSTQIKNLINAEELFASSSLAARSAAGNANGLANFGTGVKNVGLNILQKVFVTIPKSVFDFTRTVGNRRYLRRLENLKGGELAARRAGFDTRRFLEGPRNFIRNLKIFGRGNLPKLTPAQLDDVLIRRYGYSFCIQNNLLTDASIAYGRAALAPMTSILYGGTRLLRNITAVYLSGIIIGLAADAVLFGLSSILDAAESWFERTNPITTKILLSPQDDNIFPPPPEEYLVRKSAWNAFVDSLERATWKSYYVGIRRYGFGLIGYGLSQGDENKARIIKNAYLKGDTRLSTRNGENKYTIENSTIWEVLHEMSLRHPGYLYGVRKYGNGLESRVFFGKSSQRYFSKEISKKDADLLNGLDKLFLKNNRDIESTPLKEVKKFSSAADEDNKTATLAQLLQYWNEKTKERFVPYRKYHSIDSEHDIISNSLRVDSSKVVNQVNIIFKSADGYKPINDNVEISTKLKAVPYIKESMINEKSINYPNCKGVALASRYGLSELVNSGKQMYSGEILIVGNPKIETDDICIMTDDYLNMYGPIEVEAVTHMFSYETGFVTEITPNAVLFAKDDKLINMMSGSFVFEAQRKLIDKYPDRHSIVKDNQFNEEKINKVIDDALTSYFSESDSGAYNAIYNALSYIPGATDLSSLSSEELDKIKNEIRATLKDNLEKGNILFLSDITENIEIGTQLSNGGQRIVDIIGIGGALGYGGVKGSQAIARQVGEFMDPNKAFTSGFGSVGQNIKNSFTFNKATLAKNLLLAGSAFFAARLVGKETGALLNNSLKSGYLGKNMFRDILMTQIDHGQLITLMPLVKDGKPLAAGGYEYIRQRDRFKEVMGDFFNPIRANLEAFKASVNEKAAEAELIGIRNYNGFSARRVVEVGIQKGLKYLSQDALGEDTINMFLLEGDD